MNDEIERGLRKDGWQGRAVDEVTRIARELLESLVTNAPPRDSEVEAAKARTRTALRFRGAPAV